MFCDDLLLTAAFAAAIAVMPGDAVHASNPEPQAQEQVSFPTQDGGLIHADLYGEGDRAAVLAHGGRFDKESWEPQARGSAHAQFLFQTDQADRLMREILRFLSAP